MNTFVKTIGWIVLIVVGLFVGRIAYIEYELNDNAYVLNHFCSQTGEMRSCRCFVRTIFYDGTEHDRMRIVRAARMANVLEFADVIKVQLEKGPDFMKHYGECIN